MKLALWLFAICLFTSSVETELTLDLGGHVHLCQLLIVFVVLAAVAHVIQHGRILWPLGGTALLLWVCWQFMLFPSALSKPLALHFLGLLVVTTAAVFAVTQLFGASPLMGKLMRIYLWSFVPVSVYGLLQFIGPLFFHITLPDTRQWWIHGHIARINAFCFEPASLITYLFPGWVMLVDLHVSRAKIVQSRGMHYALAIVTLVMVLSTSRTGYVCMLVEGLARIAPPTWAVARRFLTTLIQGRPMLRLPSARSLFYIALGTVALGGLFVSAFLTLNNNPAFLLGGTGLDGTAAHSTIGRIEPTVRTWEAFKAAPLTGWGEGDLVPRIAAAQGTYISTMDEARLWWPSPVHLELLASSGIIGIIPFLVFFYRSTWGAYRYATRRISEERGKWLQALARSMMLLWVLLLADDNLMRISVWFHFVMVTVVAYNLQYGPVSSEQFASGPAAAPSGSFHLAEAPATI